MMVYLALVPVPLAISAVIPYVYLSYVWGASDLINEKSDIEDLSRKFYHGLDPLLLFPSLSWPSSASRIPSRCRLRVYSLMNGS